MFLLSAALNGHFDILKVLSAYGADLGKASTDGNTPMHLAASRGYGPICKYLGQRGNWTPFRHVILFYRIAEICHICDSHGTYK